MSKFLGLLALVVLVGTAGCGGGMSLDDYAEECGEWREDYGSWFSPGDPDDKEDALEDWKALNPPGEAKDLHETRTKVLELTLEAMEKSAELYEDMEDLRDERDDARRSERREIDDEIDDLQDEMEDLWEDLGDELEDLQDEAEDAEDDLSRRDRRTLDDEGCI